MLDRMHNWAPVSFYLVAGAGKLHFEICLMDLQEDFMGVVEIIKSDPVVSFRETALEKSMRSVMSKSANKRIRLYMEARPMEEGLAESHSQFLGFRVPAGFVFDRVGSDLVLIEIIDGFRLDVRRVLRISRLMVIPDDYLVISTEFWCYGRRHYRVCSSRFHVSSFSRVIIGYSRKMYYFYAYYVLYTLISMTVAKSTQVLAFAYMADKVEERNRGSVFAILSGIGTFSIVLGNAFSRFVSTSATFQVSVVVSIIALVYMMIFLRESLILKNSISTNITDAAANCLLHKETIQTSKWKHFKTLISLDDIICLLRTSPAFSKAAFVAFLSTVAGGGIATALLYYLKARFQFNKDQFAELTILSGIARLMSQLILMPILTPFFRR